jgi:hypothetical protein
VQLLCVGYNGKHTKTLAASGVAMTIHQLKHRLEEHHKPLHFSMILEDADNTCPVTIARALISKTVSAIDKIPCNARRTIHGIIRDAVS